MRQGLLLAWLLTLSGLAGCAPPTGVLLPVSAPAPGASTVEMLVVTTRAPAADPGEIFSGGRDPVESYADITVSIPPDNVRRPGEVEWPQQAPGDAATEFVTLKVDVTQDRARAKDDFSQMVKQSPKRTVLVFVHGFNNRFEDAVFRLAQFVHDSRANVTPVLFTWPSKGSVFAYGYDRESANYSRDALERLLRWLAEDPQVGEIAVLAHSMGNWVTLEALRQMAIRDRRVAPKIRNVMLAAPDVDFDVSRTQILAMGPTRPDFTLFLSESDKALAFSRKIWGAPRLGDIDPYVDPYRAELAKEHIHVFDVTGYHSPDPLHHGTALENPQIVKLIGASLDSGQVLTDSRVGLGERVMQLTAGAASTVGEAAGLAATAPIAVIDPTTREHYGDQMQSLTETLPAAIEAE
ncbi:MAG TPA: alpha/beta hydrolase [Methylocella sp.]|nr:alpha/beta hydrolase [Methylocella sp.]